MCFSFHFSFFGGLLVLDTFSSPHSTRIPSGTFEFLPSVCRPHPYRAYHLGRNERKCSKTSTLYIVVMCSNFAFFFFDIGIYSRPTLSNWLSLRCFVISYFSISTSFSLCYPGSYADLTPILGSFSYYCHTVFRRSDVFAFPIYLFFLSCLAETEPTPFIFQRRLCEMALSSFRIHTRFQLCCRFILLR